AGISARSCPGASKASLGVLEVDVEVRVDDVPAVDVDREVQVAWPGVTRPCARKTCGRDARVPAISPRAGSGRRASTPPRLPWPPPYPRSSAGSACPTAAPHWRRRSPENRL